jgi:hypothetical protein
MWLANIGQTPNLMQFLFNVIAFYHNTPVFYRISQNGLNEYFAEPSDNNMKSFTLKKFSGVWISEGGYTEWQAAQIGEKIDKMHLAAINN